LAAGCLESGQLSRRRLIPQPAPLLDPSDLIGPERWRPLVAVLPFAHTRDAELHLLGGEIFDLLRERLARDPAVQAILISSDFLAKAPPYAVDLICRELRIGYLISGRCHGDADEPSLYVELTDTHEWSVQWAQFFRGDARQLLAQDSAAMAAMVAGLQRELVTPPRR
jgi:TolB-like protein